MNLVRPARQSDLPAKLAALRSRFTDHQLNAYLVPAADEHLNEYLPESKQRRKWMSGFTGSAGDFLVGTEQAWLFADSRYYEQAEQELDATWIQTVKVGLENHKTLEETLEDLGRESQKAGQSFRLGYDPFAIAVKQFRSFKKKLEPCGITLVPLSSNLVDWVRTQAPWNETTDPNYATSPLFAVPDALTGESPAKKLERLRGKLSKANAEILPITKLDQIAWLFNMRGWDVAYNPVFIAYAVVTHTKVYLFTNRDRIPADLCSLLEQHTTVLPYQDYAPTLQSLLTHDVRVLIDPKHTTMGTVQLLKDDQGRDRCKTIEVDTPIEHLKACKNATEIEQMQQANLKASRAKTRTIKWLQDQLAAGKALAETDVAHTIETFYAEEADFQGLSFNTIAGSGTNSSIVHYGTPSPTATLQSGDFLLLDSGAQYASGTTDDTRTFAIGTPTAAQIERYTEVLKAHINCAMQQFPKGTTGAQLDGITRSTLWHLQLDYGHGTGHGVGAFLNVHEGPNGISKRVSEELKPGMINSIEPGYYKPGWGGIRIENLYVIKEVPKAELKDTSETAPPWYCFESLTYIPFDKALIDCDRLDYRQRAWLDQYYQQILEKLTPTLNETDATWLQATCSLP
jgi:Xaa-Pro aminopeptidase